MIPFLQVPLFRTQRHSRQQRRKTLDRDVIRLAASEYRSDPSPAFSGQRQDTSHGNVTRMGLANIAGPSRRQLEDDARLRSSPEHYSWEEDSPTSRTGYEFPSEPLATRGLQTGQQQHGRNHPQRRPSNRDEFDGPHQLLAIPPADVIAAQEQNLPHLPTNLLVNEQDDILSQVNDCLSRCAFNFVAKYQFPIPLEPDKRPVGTAADREWNEWVYLLKRLATKRRIPARVLYNGQIKQLVTVLENSLEMRHAAKHQSRPLKDDRNVLQLISAGLQVAKILKDASSMAFLDDLYVRTEARIQSRKSNPGFIGQPTSTSTV
ncbi:hypothetical protein MMC18_007250 [Xylographa bjoerkii]|nr:hypothetical protein [Xylographa bjoerkii]